MAHKQALVDLAANLRRVWDGGTVARSCCGGARGAVEESGL